MFITLDFVNFRFNDNALDVLLTKRLNKDLPGYGEFTIQGGMVWEAPIEGNDDFDEDLHQAGKRILNSRLDIKPNYVEQIEARGSAVRDSRGWSVTLPHVSLIGEGSCHSSLNNEDSYWEPYLAVDKDNSLPFDHNELLTKCFTALFNKAKYTSILLYLLNDKFTIAEAVEIFKYFNLKVSKQTMHSRWVKAGLIKETGEFSQNSKGGKPAALYELCENELSYFDIAIGSL